MQTLRPEIERCPCAVCRSDLAYIVPCESPAGEIVITEIVSEPKKPIGTGSAGGNGFGTFPFTPKP
jgi:hypothetical protein